MLDLWAQCSDLDPWERALLHACHLIHGLGAGGAEQVLVELGRCASNADLRLSVVSLVDNPDPFHAHLLGELGVDVRTLSVRSRWDVRAIPRAMRVVDELAPDILHTHMKHADVVGAVVAHSRRLPLVSTLHMIEDEPTPVRRLKRAVAAHARSQVADRVIAVSQAQREWYLQACPSAADRVVTISNGVTPPAAPDEDARAELRASLGVTDDSVLAMSVAIMRPGKGHDDLLAATASLPDESPVIVALVGDGVERPRLEKRARANPRIRRRVRFAGWRTDVAELMHAADFVVHPSHADALPTTIIQALAAGTPVVATRAGGIPELVTNDLGALVAPSDPEQLAAVMSALAQAPRVRERMGAAAKRRFAERFDGASWARDLVALYQEVLDERSPH
ncbi:MAG: glycosyltransferase [Actinomycetes bacterium]